MSPLRLPDNAASVLERAYRGEADTSEFDDKWLIYVTDNTPADAKELAHLAMDYWQPVEESEREELSFSRPAVQVGTNSELSSAVVRTANRRCRASWRRRAAMLRLWIHSLDSA